MINNTFKKLLINLNEKLISHPAEIEDESYYVTLKDSNGKSFILCGCTSLEITVTEWDAASKAFLPTRDLPWSATYRWKIKHNYHDIETTYESKLRFIISELIHIDELKFKALKNKDIKRLKTLNAQALGETNRLSVLLACRSLCINNRFEKLTSLDIAVRLYGNITEHKDFDNKESHITLIIDSLIDTGELQPIDNTMACCEYNLTGRALATIERLQEEQLKEVRLQNATKKSSENARWMLVVTIILMLATVLSAINK